jgi:putative transposase
LKVCNISSSTWYDRQKEKVHSASKPRGRPIPGFTINPDGTYVLDSTITSTLKGIRDDVNFKNAGGYHKLKHYLRRDYGFHVNGKKIYRLCKENNLLLPRNKKKIKTNRKVCTNKVITGPNQLWEFDIKYGYIHGENRHFYILAFIDVFNRKQVNYHVGLSCKASDLKFTFNEALIKENITDNKSLTLRSDNGPQMTSHMFKNYIATLELDHEFIPPGACNKNAHVESFNSIIESDFLQVRYFKNFADVYRQTAEWMEFYNKKRIHGSLKMMSPLDFTEKYRAGDITIRNVVA